MFHFQYINMDRKVDSTEYENNKIEIEYSKLKMDDECNVIFNKRKIKINNEIVNIIRNEDPPSYLFWDFIHNLNFAIGDGDGEARAYSAIQNFDNELIEKKIIIGIMHLVYDFIDMHDINTRYVDIFDYVVEFILMGEEYYSNMLINYNGLVGIHFRIISRNYPWKKIIVPILIKYLKYSKQSIN